ncbi:MAG: hypothetical protein NTW21_27275 [Verrucomicrobia bacterium]|nr:hypothetical protein [Verrucomicrobiota bacterium]
MKTTTKIRRPLAVAALLCILPCNGTNAEVFPIATDPGSATNPGGVEMSIGLAFDGANYLVAWSKDVNAGYPVPTDFDIYYGSYIQDWQVQFEVNIGTVALTENWQQVGLDMTVLNNDNWNRAYQEINFKVTRDSLGLHRAINSNVRVDYAKLVPDASQPTSVQAAVLRVTFEAATKALRTWYSETSGAQTPTWQLLRQVDIDAAGSNWKITAASTFSVGIGGFSDGCSVTPGHAVFIDNFQATSAMTLAAIGTWRLQYFGNPANTGNGADLATPDHDGIANLVKYGLNIAPGASDVRFQPPAQIRTYAEGKRLALVFTRDPTRNDITLQVQAAASPEGPWTTVATSANGAAFTGSGFVGETAASGGLKTVEVRDTVNITAAPRRFMRVTVTR